MKIIYKSICLIWVVCFFNCKNKSDLRGDAVIAGTLYLTNIHNGVADSGKLGNTTLFVQTIENGTNSYLYSTRSDSDGNFLFTNLVKGADYWIFGSVDSMGAEYRLQQVVTAGTINIALSLTHSTTDSLNELRIQVVDSANTPVAGFRVYVFNSKVLAANNDSLGSIFQLVSDTYGKSSKDNIQPGTYYINGKDSVGNILLSGKDTVSIGSVGIFNTTLKLRLN